MLSTEVTVALITLLGMFITAVMAVVNTIFSKKLERIEKTKNTNGLTQVENNILAQVVPVLEKKDVALDRIADILEVYGRRLDLIELGQKNFTTLLNTRCQAPQLLEEIQKLQKETDNRLEREHIIASIIPNTEEGGE
jgi:hypothetical protein